jgi:hypothetical protein
MKRCGQKPMASLAVGFLEEERFNLNLSGSGSDARDRRGAQCQVEISKHRESGCEQFSQSAQLNIG